MRHLAAVSSLLLATACGHDDWPSHVGSPRAEQAPASCHAQIDLSPPWQEGGKQHRALNLTLSSESGIPVPYHVTTKGPGFTGFSQVWNCQDEGSGKDGLKLLVKEGWQSLRGGHGNEVKLGGLFTYEGNGDISEVAINGQACTGAVSQGPKAQDAPSKAQTETQTAPAPAPVATAAVPAPAPAPAPAADGDEAALKETVRGYIEKLMNVPREVPADVTHAAETRGGSGNYEKLSDKDREEFIAAIIFCAKTFTPPHLTMAERTALIAVDISAESAFRVNTAGMNPNAAYGLSTGPQQLTASIWLPMFKERCNTPGLTYYDGSPWDPAKTTDNGPIESIWQSMTISNWAISGQAKSGAGNPRTEDFEKDAGNLPHSWQTGLESWVVGYNAARKGPGDHDFDAQVQHYLNCQNSDLALLGLKADILAAEF